MKREEDAQSNNSEIEVDQRGCWERTSHRAQAGCYQIMAHTFWNRIISGFAPAREIGTDWLTIQPDDEILYIGEGTGLDFDYLPENYDQSKVKAIDYSSAMVEKMRRKARECGIPVENCTQGDAQRLMFADQSFDKLFFPLSLASIPNPRQALQEAERVLKPGGKIVIFEKLVDDSARISWGRRCVGLLTNCLFADINRNLSTIMGEDSALKIIRYESLSGRLQGCCTNRFLSGHYRMAVLTRKTEYADQAAITAQPRAGVSV